MGNRFFGPLHAPGASEGHPGGWEGSLWLDPVTAWMSYPLLFFLADAFCPSPGCLASSERLFA